MEANEMHQPWRSVKEAAGPSKYACIGIGICICNCHTVGGSGTRYPHPVRSAPSITKYNAALGLREHPFYSWPALVLLGTAHCDPSHQPIQAPSASLPVVPVD